MINLLTDAEVTAMKQFILDGHENMKIELEDIKLDKILQTWSLNKKNLFEKMFSNSLMLEYPIEIEMRETEAYPLVQEFIRRQTTSIQCILDNRSLGEIINNKLLHPINYDGSVYGKSGMKLSRAIGTIFENQRMVESFQISYSKLLQKLHIKGILVFSIHPLDYITMSVNRCKWQSCQAIGADRQAAVLSYMQDTCTIVVYVKSEKDIEYEDFLWNNKNWRVLTYLEPAHKKYIISKQYPNDNPAVITKIMQILNEKLEITEPVLIRDEEEIKEEIQDYEIPRDEIEILKKYEYDDLDVIHYNDVIKSFDYCDRSVDVVLVKDRQNLNSKIITVGYPSTCVCCESKPIIKSTLMVCETCGEFIPCSECGEPISPYETRSELVNDKYYCTDCFDYLFFRCHECGKVARIEESHFMDYGIVCDECYKDKEGE